MSDTARPARGDALDLQDTATTLLAAARDNHSGRDARTIVATTAQRATLIALINGAELSEHQSPSSATLQVLVGRIRLHSGTEMWEVAAGELIAIPPQRHGVTALDDAAFLLTVALR